MLWHDLNCERVLHMCKSHVSDMKESCLRHEGVMSHTWRSHVPQMIWIAICTCARVMSHIRRSHVSHMNESCLTYERVMSHIWRSHVSHVKESCLTHEGGMTHVWRSLVSLIDIGTLWWWSELQLHHALFLQLHLCSQSHHSAFCAMIHHTRTALECRIILQRDGSIWGGDGEMGQYEEAMGWLRLAGPLKWKVSSAKEPLKRDHILLMRPIISKSLLIVGTPYSLSPQRLSLQQQRVECTFIPLD